MNNQTTIRIAIFLSLCLLSAQWVYSQPGNQTPPVYIMSKASAVQVSTQGIYADFILEGVPFTDYDSFLHDGQKLTHQIPNGMEDNTELGAIFRNYRVLGASTTDLKRVHASYTPGAIPTGCAPQVFGFSTLNMVVEQATALFERSNLPSIYCGGRLAGWIDPLIIRNSLLLDNGHLESDFYSTISFGQQPVEISVEGVDNQYVFQTARSTQELDLHLTANSKLIMGKNLAGLTLGSSPTGSTNSDLTMDVGSSLTLNGAEVSLVGDVIGQSGYDQSHINGATLEILGNGVASAQLNLSVANISDSRVLLTARNSALRAYQLNFSGTNILQGFGDASLAWKSSVSNESPIDAFTVTNGITTVSCPGGSCSGGSTFDIVTRAVQVNDGGMLAFQSGVSLEPTALELLAVEGKLITSGQLSRSGRDANVVLTQLSVTATGEIELGANLRLPVAQNASIFYQGRLSFDSPTKSVASTSLDFAPQGRLASRWEGATVTTHLNPSGWVLTPAPGLSFSYYADFINLEHPTNSSSHAFTNLDQASVVLEAALPGLTAQDYVDGGFDDPVHGRGTYNILVSTEGDNGWPTFIGGDRFGSVQMGASMPPGLVARVTRGLSDTEIATQAVGSDQRVIQVKLAIGAGPFQISYPPALTNEGAPVELTPTVVNGVGVLDFPDVVIVPQSGAAYQGTYTIDGSGKLTLTPALGDGGTCTDSFGTGGRKFNVVVDASRSGLTDPDTSSVSLFELTVCTAASSISPYISYPNILADETVAVGAAISKTPQVFGFTPTTFTIVSGTLVDGLSLDPGTGVISGTPTKAANGGDAAFTVEASDGVTTVLDPVTLMIDPTLQYQPEQSEIGAAFSSAPPDVSAYQAASPSSTFTLTSQPAGTWAIDSTGVVSGTPEVFGDNVFTVAYQVGPDGANNEVTTTFHLTVVGDPIAISYPSAQFEPGQAVSLMPAIQNDRDTVTYSVPANSLPVGWTINAGTGEISGVMPQGSEPRILVTAADRYTSGTTTASVMQPPPGTQTVSGGPGGTTAILSAHGCTAVASAAFIAPPDSPTKPADYVFPFDLLDFTLTGCSTLTGGVTVDIQYSQPFPSGTLQLFKAESGQYFQYGATLGADRVTFTLTDNGYGDEDATVGTIHDPAGVGLYVAPVVTPVPSTPLWLQWLMALGVLIMGLLLLTKEPQKRNQKSG